MPPDEVVLAREGVVENDDGCVLQVGVCCEGGGVGSDEVRESPEVEEIAGLRPEVCSKQ